MSKKPFTAEQLYKINQKKAKIYSVLAPIILWFFLVAAIAFFVLALKNSVGNVTEILYRLDKENYTIPEIQENYAHLVERWGEWEIVGEENSIFTIRYVNVANALFSGVMKTFLALSIICFIAAVGLGKIAFPLLAKMYSNGNEELVALATLKSASQIDKISAKAGGKEWF